MKKERKLGLLPVDLAPGVVLPDVPQVLLDGCQALPALVQTGGCLDHK